jgi:hypothetical protein
MLFFPLVYACEYVIYIVHVLQKIPYYCSYCIPIQVVGFGYPLGLVWGEEGVFSPESLLWRFWVLSSGFRICSAGIVLAELVGLLMSQRFNQAA